VPAAGAIVDFGIGMGGGAGVTGDGGGRSGGGAASTGGGLGVALGGGTGWPDNGVTAHAATPSIRAQSVAARSHACSRAIERKSSTMSGGEPLPALGQTLYVVATPIGNLRDLGLRALDVLGQVDLIAAEDTRVTAGLMAHYEIRARLVSLHEHNERKRASDVIEWLASGKRVALVTDAGTPAISDPGAALVRAVSAAGYAVVPIPGPSAVTTALSAAGIAAPEWLFLGFLPAAAGARRAALERVRALPYALVFYEAPHRISATIAALAAVLDPQREIVIARELTKRFETMHRCALGEASEWLAADSDRVRGEFVLIVAAPSEAPAGDPGAEDALLKPLLAELPLAQAVRIAVAQSGVARNRLYQRALILQKTVKASP
jgi:16S rRNA (cytidine1402-2'-O)-methyltransferase